MVAVLGPRDLKNDYNLEWMTAKQVDTVWGSLWAWEVQTSLNVIMIRSISWGRMADFDT